MKTRNNGFGSRLLMALTFLFLYAPIIILIVFSFNAGNSSSVWKGFSLHWYGELFHNRLIMHSVYITLMVSLLATVIATLAGTFASIGLYSMRRKKRGVLMAVNNIPMMNADIVTGVSLCLFFVAAFGCWNGFVAWMERSFQLTAPRLYLGFGTLLLAHISFNIPYVILDDFVISYFTAGSSTQTLAMAIYGMTKKRVSPEINAISTLLFGAVLLLLVIVNVLESRQEKQQAKKLS